MTNNETSMDMDSELLKPITIFVCEDCGAPFNTYQVLTDHVIIHHCGTPEVHSCENCGILFPDVDKLNEHSRICAHHSTSVIDDSLYLCEQCGQPCNDFKEYNDHVSFDHAGRSFDKFLQSRGDEEIENLFNVLICNQCGMPFSSSASLEEHILGHSDDSFNLFYFDQPFMRSHLQEKSIDDYSIKNDEHLLGFHNFNEKQETGQGIRVEASHINLSEVMKLKSEPEVSYSDSMKQLTDMHKPLFRRKQKLKCLKCGVRFGCVKVLTKHRLSCFKCRICPKTYLSKITLETHIKKCKKCCRKMKILSKSFSKELSRSKTKYNRALLRAFIDTNKVALQQLA